MKLGLRSPQRPPPPHVRNRGQKRHRKCQTSYLSSLFERMDSLPSRRPRRRFRLPRRQSAPTANSPSPECPRRPNRSPPNERHRRSRNSSLKHTRIRNTPPSHQTSKQLLQTPITPALRTRAIRSADHRKNASPQGHGRKHLGTSPPRPSRGIHQRWPRRT